MKTYLFLLSFVLVSSFPCQSQTKKNFLDVRDGNVYNTIIIGNKTWMTQNLNYITKDSWCYENKDENCDKYGRMYNWETVMNNSEKSGTQGICPQGWHVPTYSDWEELAAEYKKTKDLLEGEISGFEMKFGGCRFPNGKFEFLNLAATYWTSDIDKEDDKYVITFYAYKDKVNKPLTSYSTNKTYGQYLRCVRD